MSRSVVSTLMWEQRRCAERTALGPGKLSLDGDLVSLSLSPLSAMVEFEYLSLLFVFSVPSICSK